MNTLSCQNMQRRLLEMDSGGLTAGEREHLNACPECLAFAQDVIPAGSFLSAVAGQVNRKASSELPAALKQRVLGEMLARIGQENHSVEKPQTSSGNGAHIPTNAPNSWTWLDRLSGFWVYLRWAAIACVLLIAVSGLAVRIRQGRTIGHLEFASGPTTLHTSASPLKHQGLGQWACKPGSTLETEAKAAALFTVGKDVRIAMAGATTLRLVEREKIVLQSGSVWLSVTPGGRGFKVETPFGLVQVTGTRFGVTVNEREARVEVSEGRVCVSQVHGRGNVIAGQVLSAGSAGISAAVPRQEGKNLPGWVSQLLAAEKLAHAGSYLPSIGKQ